MNVAVVIPTYNRKERVIRAVESVMQQSHRPDEVVVIDDGSTDGTGEALAARFNGSIKLIRQPNRGAAAARNAGIRTTSAPFIAFLDSDDTWHPRKLEHHGRVMADPRIVLSATNWRRQGDVHDEYRRLGLDPEARVLDLPFERLVRRGGHGLRISTLVVRRSALDCAGFFNEHFRVAEDTDLLFRLAAHGSFGVMPEVLAERSAVVDAWQLTNPADPDYLRLSTRNTVAILAGYRTALGQFPCPVQRQFHQLFAHHLRRDLEYLAIEGRTRQVRRHARQILRRPANTADRLTAWTALVAPDLVGANRYFSLTRSLGKTAFEWKARTG